MGDHRVDEEAAVPERRDLLPALKAAFEELTEAGLGDSDISVTRRFVERR